MSGQWYNRGRRSPDTRGGLEGWEPLPEAMLVSQTFQLGTTSNNGLAGWETLLADPIGTLHVPPRALFKQ